MMLVSPILDQRTWPLKDIEVFSALLKKRGNENTTET